MYDTFSLSPFQVVVVYPTQLTVSVQLLESYRIRNSIFQVRKASLRCPPICPRPSKASAVCGAASSLDAGGGDTRQACHLAAAKVSLEEQRAERSAELLGHQAVEHEADSSIDQCQQIH